MYVLYVCMILNIFLCMFVNMYVCMYVCMILNIFLCMLVNMYVCMYVERDSLAAGGPRGADCRGGECESQKPAIDFRD